MFSLYTVKYYRITNIPNTVVVHSVTLVSIQLNLFMPSSTNRKHKICVRIKLYIFLLYSSYYTYIKQIFDDCVFAAILIYLFIYVQIYWLLWSYLSSLLWLRLQFGIFVYTFMAIVCSFLIISIFLYLKSNSNCFFAVQTSVLNTIYV